MNDITREEFDRLTAIVVRMNAQTGQLIEASTQMGNIIDTLSKQIYRLKENSPAK